MENIYKIKVKTYPDPRWLYPSERRYSASIVLGLGVVHLALASTALLLACLTLTANETPNNLVLPTSNTNNRTNTSIKLQGTTNTSMDFFHQGNHNNNQEISEDGSVDEEFVVLTENDLVKVKTTNKSGGSNSSDNQKEEGAASTSTAMNLTLAPCIMCLGSLAAGLAGLLAWKRWYIDQNIKWFFCMSVISTITSTVCLITIGSLVILSNESARDYFATTTIKPSTKFVIMINIFIASILEWVWSILSTKISFVGMRNGYPDDIVISRLGGKIQVNTVHKGNKKKNGKIAPPDILNHFPVSSKIAKYLPKKVSSNLPKEESNSEYQERVNKFLSSSNIDASSTT